MTLRKNFVRVEDPKGRIQPFYVTPEISDFGVVYKEGATRLTAPTLLQVQLAYELVPKVRDFIVSKKPYSTEVCANAVINSKSPVFVERPAGFVYDEDKEIWKIEEGQNTKVYTKKDGFEMPNNGWYVPVPASSESQELMLYHPKTGMPLRTLPANQKGKAVELLVPYLQQIWNLEEPEARELAEREISFFLKKDQLDGDASLVRRVRSRYCGDGPRSVDAYRFLDNGNDCTGVRLSKWVGAESEAFSDGLKK